MSDKKTLILEYDDFHWKSPENCLSTIQRFVDRFPNIKISLFSTPIHSYLPYRDDLNWCNSVRKLIESGNIHLAVHGIYHDSEEFKHKNFANACYSLKMAEEEFEKSSLPFVKVFRGPHWGINNETYAALECLDYTHIYTHEDYRHLITPERKIKSVIYNWNLKDEAPDLDLLIAHGHTHSVCSNGIQETFDKVSTFIENNNPSFRFVNEI